MGRATCVHLPAAPHLALGRAFLPAARGAGPPPSSSLLVPGLPVVVCDLLLASSPVLYVEPCCLISASSPLPSLSALVSFRN